MATPAVEFASVVKSYSGQKVIRDVSLAINGMVTTAIVGESGSGKSTLLQIINGLVTPDSGSVSLFGDPLDQTNLPAIRRTMGYAVQGAGLFPHLCVEDNITIMAVRESWPAEKILQRLLYLLELLDLPLEFRSRYPHELSGGQQQRVSLCRAMMLNPPLMLLDEPFSALDPITRSSIHDEFLRMQQAESRAIVLVTHDMSEAEKLASHLVILKDGAVAQAGPIDEVRSAPASDYVSQLFLGQSL